MSKVVIALSMTTVRMIEAIDALVACQRARTLTCTLEELTSDQDLARCIGPPSRALRF